MRDGRKISKLKEFYQIKEKAEKVAGELAKEIDNIFDGWSWAPHIDVYITEQECVRVKVNGYYDCSIEELFQEADRIGGKMNPQTFDEFIMQLNNK